jgi:hypothetical protein
LTAQLPEVVRVCRRFELVGVGERTIELVSRPTQLQAKVLRALNVDTSGRGKATIA